MRVTAKHLVAAYRAGKSRTVGNSSVEINPDRSVVFRLHGNAIVDIGPQGDVAVSLAGRPTPTTRSRINDILHGLGVYASVSQASGTQWLGVGHESPVEMSSGTWYAVFNPPVRM